MALTDYATCTMYAMHVVSDNWKVDLINEI